MKLIISSLAAVLLGVVIGLLAHSIALGAITSAFISVVSSAIFEILQRCK